MAVENSDPQDSKTRSNISYMYVLGALILLGYILFRWGDKMEILTLIIGLIGGSLLSGPNAVYFGGNTAKKAEPTVTQTGDSPVANVTPPAEVKP
jgi:hypothetical protein